MAKATQSSPRRYKRRGGTRRKANKANRNRDSQPKKRLTTKAARKGAPTGPGGIKKPNRFRPGTVSLHKIIKLLKNNEVERAYIRARCVSQ